MSGVVSSPAADRTVGRSMVVTRGGVVASEHPLASQVGAQILAQGGNAVDAAVAANATMGLVAPMTCGAGGDLFALVYEARTGKLYGLNASGWAPAGLTIEFLRDQGITNMPQRGIHSVTVPGAVEGWRLLLERFGRRPLADLLRPAIRLAEDGFPVTELVAQYWIATVNLLRADTNAVQTYLPGNQSPRLGDLFRNPDLARSYRELAERGARSFYEGDLAGRIVAYSQRLGGTLTAGDLQEFRGEWVEPISTTYRGWTVSEIPPNGQGIAALIMLNLMEQFPLPRHGPQSSSGYHVMIEAKKLAYADLLAYVADLRFGRVNVAGLLSKDYARQRAKLINPDRAQSVVTAGDPPEPGHDTTYLCAVDAEGNMVSLIQSNYNSFGSGLVPDGCGFALQNRGGLFSPDPRHPNALAGRKRPLHTIIPGFMARGDIRIAFGIMGGWNQAQAHAQFVANVVDHALNIQEALEAPRFTKMTFEGLDVQLETRVPQAVREQLQSKGHVLQPAGAFSQSVGGGQAVLRDFKAKVNYGASDPRKDGAAVPEPFWDRVQAP